jgi:hypothetical protein
LTLCRQTAHLVSIEMRDWRRRVDATFDLARGGLDDEAFDE